jgi:hypothetical protein
VLGVTKDAHGHVRTRDTRELDSARETLVLLRVIGLETDLELNGLTKLALLLVRLCEDRLDRLADALTRELGLRSTTAGLA